MTIIRTRYQKLITQIDLLPASSLLKFNAKFVINYLYKKKKISDYPIFVVSLKNKIKIGYQSLNEYCYLFIDNKKITLTDGIKNGIKLTLNVEEIKDEKF